MRATLGRPISPTPLPPPAPLTFEPARKAVGGPAPLLLLAPFLGIGDVDGLACRHICAGGAGGEARLAQEVAQPSATARGSPSPPAPHQGGPGTPGRSQAPRGGPGLGRRPVRKDSAPAGEERTELRPQPCGAAAPRMPQSPRPHAAEQKAWLCLTTRKWTFHPQPRALGASGEGVWYGKRPDAGRGGGAASQARPESPWGTRPRFEPRFAHLQDGASTTAWLTTRAPAAPRAQGSKAQGSQWEGVSQRLPGAGLPARRPCLLSHGFLVSSLPSV